ncbi:MAG: hypothetical protein KKA73_18075 [Chloroflexi bacterium]|nr:hypothetical protein [Chloroflexota bacterium]MBU1749596.1 hypothetical protein [Chloroflexota bacterium]MBU1879601.1 hypothetical protein [Chloroflexota bacterium]
MSVDLTQVVLVSTITQLVIQCPVFIALTIGAVIGVVALTRGRKLAGGLALGGFIALAVLLFLQLVAGAFTSVWPLLMTEQGMTMRDAAGQMQSLSLALGCTFSVLKTLGLLAIIGALAAFVFPRRS